ncbi:hypothetical protein J2847_000513 [Azospirillum agricola]|uniref:hypothetical protein n=1 Tax=Azospirillum agricola TaxID=1720247 RepID=UPI001AE3905C|nr:hypothetical protein [Azospirillum agricola]MBP2227233.1 hypothetical protein [Azospirillum agricola]
MSSGQLTVQLGLGPYSIANATRIDVSGLKAVKLTEAPQEHFQRLIDSQEMMLRHRYTEPADVSNHPAYKDYARVMVGGKEVARVDNNGFLITSNSVAVQVEGRIPDIGPTGKSGPLLAQARAEAVAKLLGGKVVASETAINQQRYDSLPKPKPIFDETAMMQDPVYGQIQETKRARLLFLAQQMA